MAKRAAAALAVGLLLNLGAPPARATTNRVLLFGGPEQQDFLGCLTCDARHPLSIWNRQGRYGSEDSPWSPWSRRPRSVPVVVDRAGNLCGNFAVDRSFPGRVTDGYLVWLLEGHDWIADHLEEVREDFRGRGAEIPPCGLPAPHGPTGSGG